MKGLNPIQIAAVIWWEWCIWLLREMIIAQNTLHGDSGDA